MYDKECNIRKKYVMLSKKHVIRFFNRMCAFCTFVAEKPEI